MTINGMVAKAFLLILVVLSFAQTSCNNKDESNNNNVLAAKLQAALDKERIDSNLVGISAAIWTESNGDWVGVSGNSHSNVALTSDMRFGMGSTSKNFTAALCLKLQDENKLNINDPISTWLPAYNNVNSNVTLKQLLNHQSGIADYLESPAFAGVVNGTNPTKVWTPTEILGLIGAPKFQPGASMAYSNTNFILAGMILEKVSNMTYKDLLKQKILTPLGLDNTYLEGYETVQGTIAHPHFNHNDIFSRPRTAIGTISWAAGCLVSTPSDLNKWWKAYLGNFLSDASKALARDFQTQSGAPLSFGLGLLEIDINGDKYEGHGGKTIGYESFSYYSKDKKYIITIMVNDIRANINKIAASLIEVLKTA